MTKKKNLIHNKGSISQDEVKKIYGDSFSEESKDVSFEHALVYSIHKAFEAGLEDRISENMKEGAGSHKISITIDINDEGAVIGSVSVEVGYTNFKERAIKESEHCVRFKSKVN